MRKSVIAGLLVAATMAAGVVANVDMSNGKVSNASKNTSANVEKPEQITDVEAEFQENQEEEKYIADLVSKMTNDKVTTKDWKVCLNYLEDNYDEILADKSVDTEKVKSYVEGYQYVEQDLTNKDNTSEVATGQYSSNYDVKKVQAYIEAHWDNYNPAYPCYKDYNGDCANFVSQCLYEGGMKMKGTDAKKFSNWFCRTSVTEQFSKVSSTWRGAEAFASYWKNNALEYKEFAEEVFDNRVAFDEFYEYANPGDAISYINSNGRPYHTVIVSYKNRDNDREVRFAAHTSFQNEKSIYDYCHNGYKTVRVYKLTNPTEEEIASYNYDMTDDEIQQMFGEGQYAEVEQPENETVENSTERRGFWQRLFGR